ncbi:head-tail connector protein [Brevundimonas sp. 2R-24]|uniref:Head-tail connector protein n=1 Tax=Peiella sedimenti TaxID=3061083 RepID=A0ABT8SHV9_9CAUL|nr:head-tail connector protein [Caulobacteraceae bacterium XZ-24]
MTDPVTLAEAKLFLRVEHDAEDGLIQLMIEAAKAAVEAEAGVVLDAGSAPGLRLAVLGRVAQAYDRREGGPVPPEQRRVRL